MATTTNYSWTTPDDTALVKDGAAAIRTLGSSVDTTVKALNPETTLGDISYRSSTANTNTRLALGTAGQVLKVNSGATAPEWGTIAAGGMTLLSTTSLTGATTTISGIVGGYKSLVAHIYGVSNATANGDFRIAPNGDVGISGIVGHYGDTQGNNDVFLAATGYLFMNYTPYDVDRTNSNNFWLLQIPQYTDAVNWKSFFGFGQFRKGSTAHDAFIGINGQIRTTSAITSLVFSNSGGNLSTGTVLLYGVN